MVNVRFVCAPVLEGVKCTLNGDIKYSDSRGFALFYGLGIGDHTYAAEKDGWRVTSEYGPFTSSIPQPGIVTIPEGWPQVTVFPLVFEFEEGEEPPAGEFKFDAYSLTDWREIFIVGSSWPAKVRLADVGEDIYAHYVVKNIGDVAGKATITVKDLDTGAVITTWSSPELAPNMRFKTTGSGAYIGKMPNKDWSLEFKVTP